MTDRILDFSDEPARLSMRNGLLMIERDGKEATSVPLAEIASVAVSHPAVNLSHGALAGLAAAGATLIVCDEKRLPVGMMIPIVSHGTQTERFNAQTTASLPLRKRVWRDIVSAKIAAQGKLLKRLHGNDSGLIAMAGRVKSGDAENLEAQASRAYWPALFKDPAFTRKRDAEDQNRFLNYGYAVLRAIVARAVCAAGLHPSLGVHHHNRYDAFCLADDLMEPFRPIVDEAVVRLIGEKGAEAPLDKETKKVLLETLTGRFDSDGESRTLFDVLGRTAASLAQVFLGEREEIILPDL